jgi:diaminohydroxyphosphoribosylaminopyrimidine deaminase/5-amino-6-(5-phosphoribosylamino)uracil reductase
MGESSIPGDFQVYNDKAETHYLGTRSLDDLITFTSEAGWNQVMIEAGSTFNSALIRANLIDEIVLYQAPTLLGSGKSFVENLGISTLEGRLDLSFGEVAHVGNDLRVQLFSGSKDFAQIFKGGVSQGGRG